MKLGSRKWIAGILLFACLGFPPYPLGAQEIPPASLRRAPPAPLDPVFPSTEYVGPTIGVPDISPVYPLTKLFWNNFPNLRRDKIKVYGWLNPGFSLSCSRNSNVPLCYAVVPNKPELDQAVLRIERVLDTVQTAHVDWGFRFSNIYGIDYRYTTAQGWFSNQLLQGNQLYGYDIPEAYIEIYFPKIAQGMVLTIGRYISPPDIEAQLAPDNYLFTHSLMFTFDTYTDTGAKAVFKLSDQWTALFGIHAGSDMAPWADSARFPSFQAMGRWVSRDNNDSVYGGIANLNDGKYKKDHTNLQQFNLTWTHRFKPGFFTATEGYYIYQYDALLGGTVNYGPITPFGGGGPGPLLPGFSQSWGAVNYTEFKLSSRDFLSVRNDWLSDPRGHVSGFATDYYSLTVGLTHQCNDLLSIRPEIRYETASRATPYDMGTRSTQTTFGLDLIQRF
jgi:hypothetical protein